MKALLLVDIQNDFTPSGTLAVPNGNDVIEVANCLMPQYDLVVATQDWHPNNHNSFASQHEGQAIGNVIEWDGLQQIMWPDHCIQGSVGAEFCAELNAAGIDEIVQKGTDVNIDSYSGFFDNGHRKATGLEALLRERGVDAVDIMGLATDYCVNFTALDAVELGFTTRLLVEGCRGVDLQPGHCERAIEAMQNIGVEIVN
jgi:nicotinamidase/pyrazinamidase